MKKEMRVCRCCTSVYQKPSDLFSPSCFQAKGADMELLKKEKERLKDVLVGFCEFCDRNNTEGWYSKEFACHKKT